MLNRRNVCWFVLQKNWWIKADFFGLLYQKNQAQGRIQVCSPLPHNKSTHKCVCAVYLTYWTRPVKESDSLFRHLESRADAPVAISKQLLHAERKSSGCGERESHSPRIVTKPTHTHNALSSVSESCPFPMHTSRLSGRKSEKKNTILSKKQLLDTFRQNLW